MIPKIIHYIWLGGKPLPKIAKKCIKSWKKYCPDFEIKRWDESNLNIDIFPYCRQAYDSKKYAFSSDVLRFDILQKEGGIYLDIDVELIKPLDEFLNFDVFAGFENDSYIAPGLILGASPQNELIKELLENYKNLSFIVTSGMKKQVTICEIFSKHLQKLGFLINNTTQEIDNIKVFSSEYFCPKNMTDGRLIKTKNTHSIHHYASTWVPLRVRCLTKLKQFIKRILGKKMTAKLKKRKMEKEKKRSTKSHNENT